MNEELLNEKISETQGTIQFLGYQIQQQEKEIGQFKIQLSETSNTNFHGMRRIISYIESGIQRIEKYKELISHHENVLEMLEELSQK